MDKVTNPLGEILAIREADFDFLIREITLVDRAGQLDGSVMNRLYGPLDVGPLVIVLFEENQFAARPADCVLDCLESC